MNLPEPTTGAKAVTMPSGLRSLWLRALSHLDSHHPTASDLLPLPGSDRYRHLKGPACSCRPIRQDYLDELVWEQILQLLQKPELVQAEIDRRLRENQESNPAQQRKEKIAAELKRLHQQMDKLLDAYQENLLSLADLRKRMPELKKRQTALGKKAQSVQVQALEQ